MAASCDVTVHVFLLGAQGVGKSSLRRAWMQHQDAVPLDAERPDAAVLHVCEVDGQRRRVHVFECDTVEDLQGVEANMRCSTRVVFMFMYDMTDMATLDALAPFHEHVLRVLDVDQCPSCLVVGTKSDVVEAEGREQGEALARDVWRCGHVCTSANTPLNVATAFEEAVRRADAGEAEPLRRVVTHDDRCNVCASYPVIGELWVCDTCTRRFVMCGMCHTHVDHKHELRLATEADRKPLPREYVHPAVTKMRVCTSM